MSVGIAVSSCNAASHSEADVAAASDSVRNGPAADYPVIIGDPFSVDGKLYTPTDSLNYDEVGYAGLMITAGAGVTASHRTLPVPSYAEVTALDSGRTILVRVEERGPMAGFRLLGLSQDASSQLGISDGAPIRVRRVNPPEIDRAKLRMDGPASQRMETPASLLAVLKRKLPDNGSTPLIAVGTPSPARPFIAPSAGPITSGANYALTPIEPTATASARTQAVVRRRSSVETATGLAAATGDYVVQAAAFSVRSNADKAAKGLGGFVVPDGRYFRVRTGPFDSRGEAQAALAKVKAAGYSDARVSPVG